MDLKTASEIIRDLGPGFDPEYIPPHYKNREDTLFRDLLAEFKGDQTTYDTGVSHNPAVDIPTAIDNALKDGLNKGDLRYISDLYGYLAAQGHINTARELRKAFEFDGDNLVFSAQDAAAVLHAAKEDGIELEIPGALGNSPSVPDDLQTLQNLTKNGWTAAAVQYAQGIKDRIETLRRELEAANPGSQSLNHPLYGLQQSYAMIERTLNSYLKGEFGNEEFYDKFKPSVSGVLLTDHSYWGPYQRPTFQTPGWEERERFGLGE